jgi:hypothetical protein
MIHRRLEVNPAEADPLRDLAWQLVERPASASDVTMYEYYWAKVLGHFVASDPIRTARAIVGLWTRDGASYYPNAETASLLTNAAQQDPPGVWEVIGRALLPESELAYRIQIRLQECFNFDVFPPRLLIEWGTQVENGLRIVADLSRVSDAGLSSLARAILAHQDNEPVIASILVGNFLGGVHSGPTTLWLQHKLQIEEQWAADSDPHVRKWADTLIAHIRADLAVIAPWEEEEELLR